MNHPSSINWFWCNRCMVTTDHDLIKLNGIEHWMCSVCQKITPKRPTSPQAEKAVVDVNLNRPYRHCTGTSSRDSGKHVI
jgi:hypothetical protein